MSLVCPDEAEVNMLGRILNKDDPVIKLYTNDVTPDEATGSSDLTEASGNGYTDKGLPGSGWGITSNGTTTGSYAQQVWTFTGALGNVYGYYLMNNAKDELLWVERFTDGPYNIQNDGDQIKITPKIELA
jgi:hypothetical protein